MPLVLVAVNFYIAVCQSLLRVFFLASATFAIVNFAVVTVNVLPGMPLRVIPSRNKRKGLGMKLINYSLDYLVETQTPTPPKQPYSDCQFRILCKIIRRKKVNKDYFYGLLNELYNYRTVKQLSYEEMYRIIWLLNHWNFLEERYRHE